MPRLDHIVINASDLAASADFYDRLAPAIGFVKEGDHIYRNAHGAAFDVRQAQEPARDYFRHGPGVNHIAVAVESEGEVHAIVEALNMRGIVAPPVQRFDGDAIAVFIPNPDGLRIEIGFEPSGP
jgi:catechol 2,3-dioxygenase-like lactoylglutathione lyase family enzyme